MRSLTISKLTLRRLGSLVGAVALLSLFASSALAKEADAPAAAPVTLSCGSIKESKFVYDGVAQEKIGGAAFVDLPGATTTITVPANTSACITARFISESACYTGAGYCSVRILIGGVEAAPAVGTDFAFDSTNGGTETSASWESHAVERIRRVTTGSAAVAYTVKVQWAITDPLTHFRLDDYSLVVDRA